MRSKPYHHGDLRQTLVQAALEIAEETGQWDLSLRQVARKANVSHAAPYNHFQDKQALLAEVAAVGYEQLTTAMRQSTNAAEETEHGGETQLLDVGRAYVRFGLQNPALYRLMFATTLPYAGHTRLQAVSGAAYAVLVEVITGQAAAPGCRHEGGNDALLCRPACAAWAYVHGLTQLALDGRLSQELALEMVADFRPSGV